MTIRAMPQDEVDDMGKEMELIFLATVPGMTEAALRKLCAKTAKALQDEKIGLENCDTDNSGNLQAEWYAEDDWVAPEITSNFVLSEVYEAVRKELRSKEWRLVKPMGKSKKARWELRTILCVDPFDNGGDANE
jgi:hypothetical protein